jgi:phenylacetate-coenzyme A ligase PaaK-like adenylate-forming protein
MSLTTFPWRRPFWRLYEERLLGRNNHRYLRFLEQMQWKSEEEIRSFQWGELQRLLRHAYEHVPFHRRRFWQVGLTREDIRTPEDYARLPILERRAYNESEDLLADNYREKHLITRRSSGSTGVPMCYQYDRDSFEWRLATQMRVELWMGVPLYFREFSLWGEPLKPLPRLKHLKRSLWRWLHNAHFAESYYLTPALMARYLEQYNRLRPQVLSGYANALYRFARFAESQGTPVWSPVAIVPKAEKVLPRQRQLLERVFQAPVFNYYGCREFMLIAHECEQHHGLHVAAENVYVEIVRNGRPAAPGEVGDVIVTDLHNYAMPFLRYRTGDLAVAADGHCACGRGLPLIESVQGRRMEVLRTPDGGEVSGLLLEEIAEMHPWIDEFQVEQVALDEVEVRLKPAPGYRPEELDQFLDELQEPLGPRVRLRHSLVDHIAPAPSGKRRSVVCSLPPEELEGAASGAGC